MERPDFFELKNGSKVKLPFTDTEYQNRLKKIRKVMSEKNIDMTILTSMHNVAYYTGFIYCSFGIDIKPVSLISAVSFCSC